MKALIKLNVFRKIGVKSQKRKTFYGVIVFISGFHANPFSIFEI